MNKSLRQVFLLMSIMTIFSCSNRNMNSENDNSFIENDSIGNKQEEIKSMTSFEFIDSYNKDVFFSDDNLDKEIEITDFLIEGYKYNQGESTCKLYCTPYDKATSTSPCYNDVQEMANKTLNGKPIKLILMDKGYDIVVYLSNPKDLKKLKIFNPSEEFVSTTTRIYPEISEIKDLKKIRCTYKGVEQTALVFVDGEILD